MATRMKPASSDEVRDWANDNGWRDQYDRPVADRGRLPTTLITEFNAANRKNRIEYVPVARGEAQPPRSDDENRGRRATSTSVARRDSAPASRSRKSDKVEVERPARTRREPVRVHSERTDAAAPAPRRVSKATAMPQPQDFASILMSAGNTAPDGKVAVLHANTTYVLEFQDA